MYMLTDVFLWSDNLKRLRGMNNVDQFIIIEHHFERLIEKMKQQVEDSQNQSFGSLENHLNLVINAKKNKEYLSPLYDVRLPRWMGEYGNTPLEDEILALAHKIDMYIVELMGGIDKVNKIREEHNKSMGY